MENYQPNPNLPTSRSNPASYFCPIHLEYHAERSESFCQHGHIVCNNGLVGYYRAHGDISRCITCRELNDDPVSNLIMEQANTIRNLREERNNALNNIEFLENQIIHSNAVHANEMINRQETINNRNARIEELEARIKDMQEEINGLNDEQDFYKSRYTSLKERNSQLEKKIDGLEEKKFKAIPRIDLSEEYKPALSDYRYQIPDWELKDIVKDLADTDKSFELTDFEGVNGCFHAVGPKNWGLTIHIKKKWYVNWSYDKENEKLVKNSTSTAFKGKDITRKYTQTLKSLYTSWLLEKGLFLLGE